MSQELSARTSSLFNLRANLRGSGLILCLAIASPELCASASAATYTVLYSFAGTPNDGFNAAGSLVRDGAGNLYGTTYAGGPYDFGTAFKLDSAGNETVLTDFDYANGEYPNPGLIKYGESLYGTVYQGGYSDNGAVVKINDQGGKATLLYSFCSLANCADGQFPLYGVTHDSAGNVYGSAFYGGAYGFGVVFKVDSAGNETVLYSFCPGGWTCSDGGYPNTGVISDSAGNLYGTAEGGSSTNCGNGPCGVVWKLDASGHEHVLHTFTGPPSDGNGPTGLLTIDGNGNLYGITNAGGSGTVCQIGCGTVFKVDTSGNETVLHNFTGGKDGASPQAEALVLDKKGNLYGTTPLGGVYGRGVVFKLHPSGKLDALYSFQGKSDGSQPNDGVIMDKGVLYGEAQFGGDLNCSEGHGGGCGVVFKITP